MSSTGVGNETLEISYSGAEPIDGPIAGDAHCDAEPGCITCGDVAVPLRVALIDAERGLALCEDAEGRRETVEIALVEPVATGDHLLVHAGTAIAHTTDPAGAQAAAPGDALPEGSG